MMWPHMLMFDFLASRRKLHHLVRRDAATCVEHAPKPITLLSNILTDLILHGEVRQRINVDFTATAAWLDYH